MTRRFFVLLVDESLIGKMPSFSDAPRRGAGQQEPYLRFTALETMEKV